MVKKSWATSGASIFLRGIIIQNDKGDTSGKTGSANIGFRTREAKTNCFILNSQYL